MRYLALDSFELHLDEQPLENYRKLYAGAWIGRTELLLDGHAEDAPKDSKLLMHGRGFQESEFRDPSRPVGSGETLSSDSDKAPLVPDANHCKSPGESMSFVKLRVDDKLALLVNKATLAGLVIPRAGQRPIPL
jgi:hypothetical protein